MTDTSTTAPPSKTDIAWRVIKMVFHSDTINAQTDISDFFTSDRLTFYANLFNGPVATAIESTPYRWVPATAADFSGITTGAELEKVVEAHLTDAPAATSTTSTTTATSTTPEQGGSNA